MGKRVVIVGGVACGPKAAARLRRLDPETQITVVEQGEQISYAGCGLPYFMGGDIKDVDHLLTTASGAMRDSAYFKTIKNIDFLTLTRAESIDREKKILRAVSVKSGESIELPYDNLVLATGARPWKPPIEGLELQGVSFLTRVDEAVALRAAVNEKKGGKAVILGAGLIGLEAAEAFRGAGWQVQILEMQEQALGSLLDEEIARSIDNALFESMVSVSFGEKALRIEDDGSGHCKAVVTEKATYPADVVLVATGFRPNVDLAKSAGLAIGSTGAIAVNDRMQTSDPAIYAGGDCVECKHLVTGEQVFVPLGSTANKHGRIIGDNIAGIESRFPGVLGTAVVKVFNLNVGRTGLTEKQAREAGFDPVCSLAPGFDKAHYYPGSVMVAIKMVADRKTQRILGLQAFGSGEIARRVDVAVAAISMKATVSDLASFDLGYAPPFSQAVDAILTAANVVDNKIKGVAHSIMPQAVKQMIEDEEDFVLLDVRSPREFEIGHIDASQTINLPIERLRAEADKLPLDKRIITLCKISQRGYEAHKILAEMGFKDVAFMDGGMFTWPYPDDVI